MSYTINLTNGNTLCTIPDGTINSNAASTLTLVGKNYAGYGQFLDDNFVRTLENSSNGTAPGAPLVGQQWWDSTNKVMKVYPGAGSAWKAVGSATSGNTAPASASSGVGDLWFDTANQQMKVYNGISWELVGPAYAAGQGVTGAIPATVYDGSGNPHTVLETYSGNTIVAITSADPTFTPAPAIPGFTTINPGTTMATSITNTAGNTSANVYFWGTATNALNLGGIPASQYIVAGGNSTGNITTSGNISGGNVIATAGLYGASVTTTGNANVGGNLLVSGSSTLTGPVTTGGNLTVNGTTQLNGPLNTTGNATIGGNLVAGNVILNCLAVGAALIPTGVDGEIIAANNITGYYSSDSKYKTNVRDINDATSKVKAIGGKTFDWTDEYLAGHGGEDKYFYPKSDYGVIAQDVQAVFPTAVRTREDGSLAIDYGRLSALALAAIKELAARVEALEAKSK